MSQRNEAVIKFMQERRSVPSKTMGGPGPSKQELIEIVKIASRVPDHGKLAPWRFVELSSKAKQRLCDAIYERALEKDGDIGDAQAEIEKNRLPESQTILLMFSKAGEHPKIPIWEQELSAGAAGMNMLIAANAFGYDAQWFTGWYAFDEKLIPQFGAQEGERIAGFFHMGQKLAPKTERTRPEIGEIFSTMES